MLDGLLGSLVPNQGGALWIGLIVAFAVFGDLRRLRSPRNAALLGLLALAPLFVDILEWRGDRAAWVFTGVFLLTAGYAVWGLVVAFAGDREPWRTNIPAPGAAALLAALLVLNASVTLTQRPDDAGIYTNLGTQRFRETGVLPYGDEKLKGPDAPAWGAAATYGPLMYLAHVPAQWLVGGEPNPPSATPRDNDTSYRFPPYLTTQLTVLAFHLLALAALYLSVRALANTQSALGAVAIYAAMPYLVGLGGEDFVVGGLRFVSHIAPSAVLLVAFSALAAWKRAAAAGVLLAAAAGTLFYPAFMFPAWLGWYLSRSRRDAVRFGIGFAVAGLVIAVFVIVFTRAPDPVTAIRWFFQSTLEHQEGVGPREYGASTFSFWGTHPGLAGFWQQPLAGAGSLLKPMFLLYAAFAASAFLLARDRSVAQLAGITAALGAGIQLWKTHATGSYVEWYLPFLIIALVVGSGAKIGTYGEDAGHREP